MSEDRLEYAYEAAVQEYWSGAKGGAAIDAFLAAIAERGDPEDIVALLGKVGYELKYVGPRDSSQWSSCHGHYTFTQGQRLLDEDTP